MAQIMKTRKIEAIPGEFDTIGDNPYINETTFIYKKEFEEAIMFYEHGMIGPMDDKSMQKWYRRADIVKEAMADGIDRLEVPYFW